MVGEILGGSAITIIVVKEVFGYLKSRTNNALQSRMLNTLENQTQILTRQEQVLQQIREINLRTSDKISTASTNVGLIMERQGQAKETLDRIEGKLNI